MIRKLYFSIMIIVLFTLSIYLSIKNDYELRTEYDETIILNNKENYYEKLKVENLEFKPGDVIEYRIAIRSEEECVFEVSFNFDEVCDGELKKYVDVEISSGRQRYNRKLNYLLESDGVVTFICDIVPNKNTIFCIKYIMTEDIKYVSLDSFSEFSIELFAKNL